MIRIVCTSCQKPLSLDETKLPDKEVAFPCPVCKTKLSVDRRNYVTGERQAPEARDFYMQEYPQVVMINPGQITPPPLEAMQPIISLTPADRRRAFFILFSDNLRTLDGNAAFLYGVNLVVAPKDLPAFPQIYRDAHGYHERLYASMSSVLKAMHS